jgi:hypothetical protein
VHIVESSTSRKLAHERRYTQQLLLSSTREQAQLVLWRRSAAYVGHIHHISSTYYAPCVSALLYKPAQRTCRGAPGEGDCLGQPTRPPPDSLYFPPLAAPPRMALQGANAPHLAGAACMRGGVCKLHACMSRGVCGDYPYTHHRLATRGNTPCVSTLQALLHSAPAAVTCSPVARCSLRGRDRANMQRWLDVLVSSNAVTALHLHLLCCSLDRAAPAAYQTTLLPPSPLPPPLLRAGAAAAQALPRDAVCPSLCDGASSGAVCPPHAAGSSPPVRSSSPPALPAPLPRAPPARGKGRPPAGAQ